MTIRVPRCAVFDLDGTLVDSVPDLTAALNRVMASRGLAPFVVAEVVPMVGDGAAVLVRRAFAARGTAPDDRALDDFLMDYGANAAVATVPYPGTTEALDALRAGGWVLAVCTNKPEAPARTLLDALGLLGRFAAIGGGDSFPVRKPDPAHLIATLGAAGGIPQRSVMIGDHRNDVMAASGAGLPCIFATWGFGPLEMGTGAAATASRMSDVPEIADRLIPA